MKTKLLLIFGIFIKLTVFAQDFKDITVESVIAGVQPMTGIVFWRGDNTDTDVISLEYSYMLFNKVVKQKGVYDWTVVDELLEDVASRNHQAILRFRYTYVGYKTAVPDYIKALPDYHETKGKSEGETTWFPDWSHEELKRFNLEFYRKFAKRYDKDPRLAFVQVGFGLWAEYHIYDGPFELGKTFPDKAYQEQFFYCLDSAFNEVPWSISIDAADSQYSPFEEKPELLKLKFGNFDDSFMAEEHPYVNALNWKFFGEDRYKLSPAGGEFSYYTDYDQRHVLDLPDGAHGISYEEAARKFHISYIIGNDQPQYQSMERIKQASMASGYKFQLLSLKSMQDSSIAVIKNVGIASIYYDAFPTINFVKSRESLKGLAPGETKTFYFSAGCEDPDFRIICDHILPTQTIEFIGNTYNSTAGIEILEAKIFPNILSPNTLLNISLKQPEKTSATIFDINGNAVLKTEFNNIKNSINISMLNSGFYFIKLESNSKKVVKKFLIK